MLGAVFADGHYETLLARHNIELTTLYWFYCTVYFREVDYLKVLSFSHLLIRGFIRGSKTDQQFFDILTI